MNGFFNSIVSQTNIPETWVFVVAGQSNALPGTGGTGIGNPEDYPVGTLQWGRHNGDDNTIVPATEPLQHVTYINLDDGPGLAVRFANRMKDLYPNVRLLFIPCAENGSSFLANQWNRGNYLYNGMVVRTNLCMSQNPSFKFKGFLWQQGESDSGNVNYETILPSFVNTVREDIIKASETSVFLLGGQVPLRLINDTDAIVINNITKNIPNQINYTAYVDPMLPTQLEDRDNLHYTSASSLILGDRYFDAYFTALTNNSN